MSEEFDPTVEADRATEPDVKTRLAKTIDTWKKTAARYDDDAKSNEGRKQLAERAKHVAPFVPRYTTGVLEKFARMAQGAEKGAVTTR